MTTILHPLNLIYIGSLTSVVGAAVYSCVQNFPARGWIRGELADGATDIKAEIEKYMQEHTATKADIDALFKDNSVMLNCGDSD